MIYLSIMKEDDITILAVKTCDRLRDTLVAIVESVAARDIASFEEDELAKKPDSRLSR